MPETFRHVPIATSTEGRTVLGMTHHLDIHDLCALFGLSKGRMYAVTHLPEFPPCLVLSPRRHRWDRDQVMAYRDQRVSEKRTSQKRRVRLPVPSTAGARIVGVRRPVQSRKSSDSPVRMKIMTPEGVTVYPPQAEGGRWRAVWTEPDGTPASCLARDEAQMDTRLKPVASRLQADAGRTLEPVSALIEFYLRRARWASSYRVRVEHLIKSYILPQTTGMICEDVTERLLNAVVNSPSGYNTAKRLSGVVSGLVQAGLDGGYLENSSLGKIHWRDRITSSGSAKVSVVGLAEGYITADKIPGHDEVAALASAMRERCPWWLELAVHLSAYSGLRFGELAALRVDCIDVPSRQLRVARQASEVFGKIVESAPKGGKTRTAIYPAVTPGGYPLAAMMERRVAELTGVGALDDKPPLAFHAPDGGFLRGSNFSKRVLRPAYDEAGWRHVHSEWTWHSLRHVFCTTALTEWGVLLTDTSTLAGHATTAITADMYIDSMSGVIERVLRATEGPSAPDDPLALTGTAPTSIRPGTRGTE